MWLSLMVFVSFSALYFTIGSLVAQLPVYYTTNNIFFGADHLDAVRGWTSFSGRHFHDGVHPLTLIFLVPAGTVLARLAGSPALGVLALSAAGGGLTVALGYGCFYRLAHRPYGALAPATLLGFSMSQLVFGSLPETYALAGATLALTYFLTIRDLTAGRIHVVSWCIAGFLTFSVLITNFVQTAIAYAGVVFVTTARSNWVKSLVIFVVPVLGAAVLLSLLQQQIFPTARLFFSLDTASRQTGYFGWTDVMANPAHVAGEVLSNSFRYNLAGVDPVVTIDGTNPDADFTFYGARFFDGIAGLIGLGLWLGLFADGLYHNLAKPRLRGYAAILGTMLAVNLVSFSLFNVSELFLYSVHVTLLVMLFGFHGCSLTTWPRLAAWWMSAGLVATNNLAVLYRFGELLRHM